MWRTNINIFSENGIKQIKSELIMKVLMQSRKNFYSLKGGDTIQLLKTKAALEELGMSVDISLEYTPDLSNYDLVHLSNLTRIQETYLHVQNAIKYQKPILLSTIYWPMDEFEKRGQVGIRKRINHFLGIDGEERVKAIARFVTDKSSRDIATKNLWKIGYTKMQQFVIKHTDYFLPNSEMEMDILCENFGIVAPKYTVIPNAIDDEVAKKQSESEIPEDYEKYRNAIICVGRIEPRKNQLALVKALDQTNYKLVLVGTVSNNQKKYFDHIKYYLGKNKNFFYISQIDNDNLYSLYKVCKVSALPSWLDTPGLVSLEAAAMGCNLAISSKGSTTEYFGKYAEYCMPDDIASIRSAIDRAYNAPKNVDLVNHIYNNYTWKIAARRTIECYKTLLL